MVQSVKRRAKRNTKSKEHKQQLVDMPLDVLIEIFLFLEPLDLLHLSRTTKAFRAFLLSRRKSSALWKNVISNFKDFSPCPDYMSAPAYTHLAFVPVCHRCSCPCETIEWELRMRCCPRCFQKMRIPHSSVLSNNSNNYLIGSNFPMARDHYKLHYDCGLDITVSLPPVEPIHSLSLLDWRVVQRRKRLNKVVETMREFLAQQNDFWGSIRRHARSCRDWEYARLKEKAVQLSLVRRQRVEELKALGWVETSSFSYYDHNFLQLPEVKKLAPLTPTEWIRIRPKVISWSQRAKEESVCRYWRNVYESAVSSVRQELRCDASLKVRPLMIVIAMLPAVHSAVESNINSDLSYGDLKKRLFRALPLAIRGWSSNALEELEQFARKELGLPPLSKPSCLPSVIFRCKVCHHRLRFDKALSHHHLYKEKRKEQRNTRKMSAYDLFIKGYSIHPWNIRVLRVDVPVSRRVENPVRRMGQNPSRVTYHELCHSTVKVVRGLCRPTVAMKMDFSCAFERRLRTRLLEKETQVWTRVSARGLGRCNLLWDG